MRIDLNQGAPPLLEHDRTDNQSASSSGGNLLSAGSTLGEDQAKLSEAHVQVQALVAQVARFPEIRQEKVNALRQVVLDGSYQPGSKQIAGALFEHIVMPAA